MHTSRVTEATGEDLDLIGDGLMLTRHPHETDVEFRARCAARMTGDDIGTMDEDEFEAMREARRRAAQQRRDAKREARVTAAKRAEEGW